MFEILKTVSNFSVPIIILSIILLGLYAKINVFDEFVVGAKSGLETVIKILPSLIGLLTAVAVFRTSGALNILTIIMTPFSNLLGLPTEVVPLAIVRPFSGSASLAFLSDLLQQYGPESYVGRTACVIMGSTETIFYTVAIYLGSVNIKNSKYVIPVALVVDIFCFALASLVCKFY